MSNWISSGMGMGMGMGTGGIPTTDNMPETTEKLGCPIYDKIKCFKKSFVGYIVVWATEFFSRLGYIVSCGYPTHTRGNSVAHVCFLV